MQIGARLLHAPEGGKGLLLGGLAAALGARVTVFDLDADKLRLMDQVGPQVTSLYPYRDSLDRAVREADLLVGAVLIPGARAPHLVSRDQVAAMGAGSVVVDIAVDQGGCIETTRPTTYAAPTYLAEGVIHFGVTNMPGAVPRTASRALCASLFPWVLRLARADWPADPALAGAVNVDRGRLVLPALRQA